MTITWVQSLPAYSTSVISWDAWDTVGVFTSEDIEPGAFYDMRSDLLANPPQGLQVAISKSIFIVRITATMQFPYPLVSTWSGNPPRSQFGLNSLLDNNVVIDRQFQDANSMLLGKFNLSAYVQMLPYNYHTNGFSTDIVPPALYPMIAFDLGTPVPPITKIGWSGSGIIRYEGVILHYIRHVHPDGTEIYRLPGTRL